MLTTILTALTLGSVPALPSSRLCPVTVSPSGPRPGQFVRVSLRAGCGGVAYIRKRSAVNPQLTTTVWEVTPTHGWHVWVQSWRVEEWTPTGWRVVWPPEGGEVSADPF